MKISIGIVLYKKIEYLNFLIFSLLNQEVSEDLNIEILFRDNDENFIFSKMSKELISKLKIKKNFEIKFFKGKNEFHSKSQNFLMKIFSGDIYVCGSEDMFYPKNFFENIKNNFLLKKEKIFGVKILNWNFNILREKKISYNNISENKNIVQSSLTKKIDSFGIFMKNDFSFGEIGFGKELEKFEKTFDQKKFSFFGASGALIIFTPEIIDFFLKNDGFIFDEKYIIHYKNDIDLAFRIKNYGFSYGILDVFVYHDRQIGESKKFSQRKDFFVENSLFANLVLIKKYLKLSYGIIFFFGIFREILKFFYFLLFRRKNLKIYKRFFSIIKDI